MAAWLQALSRNVREVRLHLCQTSKSSNGVREFIQQHYVQVKQSNPRLPFLIRECSGVEPILYARYDYGKEKSLPLSNCSSAEVLKALETLAKDSLEKD